ncbi:MAG TPA: glycosyltransferase family 4 protein [Thermoanaerobaculia bacterium]|nr:glycosyltransferase family 4 protein [Thermoanaerobaculia bacterium]
MSRTPKLSFARRCVNFAHYRSKQAVSSLKYNIALTRKRPTESMPIYLSPSLVSKDHPIWKTYQTHPVMQYVPYHRARLCHWFNELPRIFRRSCITEVEHLFALSRKTLMWQRPLEEKSRMVRAVSEKRCLAVVTLSKGLMDHGARYLPRELWPKLDYLYPAYPTQPFLSQPDRPFTILTIASRFSDKGLPEVIDAFRILRQRHGSKVAMILVSQAIPQNFKMPEGITHHDIPRMSTEFKEQIYRASDVLLLPCFSDTLGCFTEATAFGVPIVTTRIHHGDEFIKDGQTGFLLRAPLFFYSDEFGSRWNSWGEFLAILDTVRESGGLRVVVDEMVARIEELLDDRSLLATMGKNAIELHRELLSPEARNVRLLSIYTKALASIDSSRRMHRSSVTQ